MSRNNQAGAAGDPYSGVVLEVETALDEPSLEFQNFATGGVSGGRIGSQIGGRSGEASQGRAAGASATHGFFNPLQPSQATVNKPASSFWHVEYYSKYFDVNTSHVLERISQSFFPKDNFLDLISPNPDLYGPFWIATTVVLVFFVTSSLAKSVAARYNHETNVTDFTVLSFAVGTVYIYAFAVPFLVWGATKYYKCAPTLLEVIDLYGYGLTVWVPISVLCVVPNDLLRWVLVAVGFALPGLFITRNMYPVLARSEGKTARGIIIFVLACHAALAFLFKFKFFDYIIKSNESVSMPVPSPSESGV